MSDFTPVELVKGDKTFTAHTPAQLTNALYARGFVRKATGTAEPETAPSEAASDESADTGNRRRSRSAAKAGTDTTEEVSA